MTQAVTAQAQCGPSYERVYPMGINTIILRSVWALDGARAARYARRQGQTHSDGLTVMIKIKVQ